MSRSVLQQFAVLGGVACVVLTVLGWRVPKYLSSQLEQSPSVLLSNREEESFLWSSISPSKQLQWQDCLPGRQCARLIVPLNYSEPEGREAVIALIRKPAALLEKSGYRGPVLFNPGGPGSSGVDYVVRLGESLSTLVGPEFDIVGFDPRGIGRSTPQWSFFKTGVERELWSEHTILNVSDGTIERQFSRSKVLNRLAAEQDDGALALINTEHTARDMLKIVEAHGQHKLQYYGFSYGTVLGATFAAMFPDRVERLVIDAVVDSENWYGGVMQGHLKDTDKGLAIFFESCSSAGPDRCAFYAPTPEAVRQNLTRLSESIRQSPIPVYTDKGYGLIDYPGLRLALLMMLFKPYATFQPFAQALADLAQGNGDRMFELGSFGKSYQCECNKKDYWDPGHDDAGVAIRCNDGLPVAVDLNKATEYFQTAMQESEFGNLDLVFRIARWGCIDWPIHGKPFERSFNTSTSHPLLIIGNTADPVAPLSNAQKMSELFKGSALLTQNSGGHGSVNTPSLCTPKYIRQYFLEGTLPSPGTICQPVRGPFDEALSKSSVATEEGSPSDVHELLLAIEELSSVSPQMSPHLLSLL